MCAHESHTRVLIKCTVFSELSKKCPTPWPDRIISSFTSFKAIRWILQASLSPHWLQFNRVQHTKRQPQLPHPIAVTTHCYTPTVREEICPRGKEKWDQTTEFTMPLLVTVASVERETEADRQTEIWLQERVSPTHNIPHPNTTTQQQALFNTSERGREKGQRGSLFPANWREFQRSFFKMSQK